MNWLALKWFSVPPSQCPKMKIVERLHGKPLRSTFLNHLFFQLSPQKLQTPDHRELQINFVQGILLQPDLRIYGKKRKIFLELKVLTLRVPEYLIFQI